VAQFLSLHQLWTRQLCVFLIHSPWFYLDEIREFLIEAFHVDIALSTISTALRRIKFTRKKLRVEAAQRNQVLRAAWQYSLRCFTANQLIFVDESGSDNRTGDRAYGYGLRGAITRVRRWLKYHDRVSALPAYTIDGYLTASTFPGTCNADIFEQFIIDELLPLCNPYPGPLSVIVMDNASIHHAGRDRIEHACLAHHVWILFLPPYSPDFNPIEESFSVHKAFIRRHYHSKIHEFPGRDGYQEFLEWTLHEVGVGDAAAKRARAHFRSAGIKGVPDEL